MKALLALALLSLIGCGAETKKVIVDRPVQSQEPDAITAPPAEVLSILSHSPLPAKFALYVNDQPVLDECYELPEHIFIDREIPLIEIDLATVVEDEFLKIEIRDRLEDCTGNGLFYIHDRVDHDKPEVNKWTNTRTVYARLNNFPREVEGEDKPRNTEL